MNVEHVHVYVSTMDYDTGYNLSNWDLVVSRAVRLVMDALDINNMWGRDL